MPSSREWRLKIPMLVSPASLQLELGPENYPCQRSLRGSSGNVSREAHVGKIIPLVKKRWAGGSCLLLPLDVTVIFWS